jgi:3-hydroxymyristoyl/3-hydroxydecanoyl-(acyl carrier protein) dehydratase
VILLPQIDSLERTRDQLSLRFSVPATIEYFDGHFPECALLPGVVQIGWAVEIARREFPLEARFRALAGVKFTRVIQPGAVVDLVLSWDPGRRELGFAYRSGETACSSGRALFH